MPVLSGMDDIHAQAQLSNIARLSSSDHAQSLRAAEIGAQRYLFSGHTTLEHSWLRPALAENGVRHVIFKAEDRGLIVPKSLRNRWNLTAINVSNATSGGGGLEKWSRYVEFGELPACSGFYFWIVFRLAVHSSRVKLADESSREKRASNFAGRAMISSASGADGPPTNVARASRPDDRRVAFNRTVEFKVSES